MPGMPLPARSRAIDRMQCRRLLPSLRPLSHLNPYTQQYAGYPWTMRRLALDVACKATDIIQQRGATTMRVTTVNARAAWTRTLAIDKEMTQRDAEGRPVRTTACWDAAGVHKATHTALDGGRVLESWRHADGGLMVVRSWLRVGAATPGAGQGVACLWFLEAVAVPPTRRLCGLASAAPPLARDARRVARASDRDTVALQALARRKGRWTSPVDDVAPRVGGASAGPSPPVSRSRSPPRRRTTAGSSSEAGAEARRRLTTGGSTGDAERRPSVATRRGLSSDSDVAGGLPSLPPSHARMSPLPTLPSLPPEVALSRRLVEYSENRSLTSVVPVGGGELAAAAAAAQPELLDLSPDQAEATQLKLAELGRAVRAAAPRRGAAEVGTDCGCVTVSWNSVTVPPYCRAWEDVVLD